MNHVTIKEKLRLAEISEERRSSASKTDIIYLSDGHTEIHEAQIENSALHDSPFGTIEPSLFKERIESSVIRPAHRLRRFSIVELLRRMFA